MTSGRKPTKTPDDPSEAGDDLRSCWARFRSGDPVPCPIDRAPLALAVDASAGTYRFVCTDCGVSSPWFESGPAGIRVRAGADEDPRAGGK
ncbi:MAG TPA: hypothetical protein VGM06_05025 [Polyangiaceae bacterium]|jgi:hypothetical protein